MSIPIPILFALAVVGLVVGALYLIGLSKRWGILVPLVGMILFGSMALPLDWNDRLRMTVWLPIQSERSLFYLLSGASGVLVVLLNTKRLAGKRLSISAMLFVASGFYASMLRFVHMGPSDGALSLALSFATLTPLLVTSMIFIEHPDDLRKMLRSVIFANIVWIGMSGVQLLSDPSMLTVGNENRFVGLLSNPQHSGALMAFFTVISLWLMLNERGRVAIFLLGLVGVNAILLMWTGSRTGMGMTVIGVSAILYSRAGRAILLLPIAAILGYVVLKVMVDVFGISLLGFERLTSTEDTRTSAWSKLIDTGMNNIILGAGIDDVEKSENSWLYGFASYGIGMLGILLLMTVATAVEVAKTIRARFLVEPHYRNTLDFMSGVLMMYFAGALLEGYMISRVSSTICFFLVISVANVNIRRILLGQQGQEMYAQDWDSGLDPLGDHDGARWDENPDYLPCPDEASR